MPTFGLTVEGFQGITASLGNMRENILNTAPVMEKIGRKLQYQTAKRWGLGISPDGVAWKRPLGLTLAIRPKTGPRASTLWSNGMLFKSVCNRIPSTGQIFRVQNDNVVLGTNLFYAHVHQEGATIRPKRAKRLAIPANRQAALAGSAQAWWSNQVSQGKRPFIPPGGKYIATSEKNRTVIHFYLFKQVEIPARPFLGIAREDLQPILDLALAWVFRGRSTAGGV